MQFSIMDQTGHTAEAFDTASKVGLDEAMKRFEELTKNDARKFTAAARRKGERDGTVTRAFDPEAEEIVFFPPLQGG